MRAVERRLFFAIRRFKNANRLLILLFSFLYVITLNSKKNLYCLKIGEIMNTFECIKTRKSVRNYSNRPIDTESIDNINNAMIWTPSGKNGQPWRIKIVTDKSIIASISNLSIYCNWMKKASCFYVVFLDNSVSYNHLKDVQSCGALMQTIMLAAHSIGIGSCWIGEILPQENSIKNILNINNDFLELMGIITLGYEEGRSFKSSRKNIESFIL